ncbi:MAG: hypothetical protein ACP5JG_14025 [Anaerolineae bacterium]
MELPEQRIRIVAGTPVEAEGRRILPSILVQTLQARWPEHGVFRRIRMRPISVVVEDEEGAKWHEIPDVTADAVNTMAVFALGIAVVSLVLIALSYLWRRS